MASAPSTAVHPLSLSAGDRHVAAERSRLGLRIRAMPVRGRLPGLPGGLHIDGDGTASGLLEISTAINRRDLATLHVRDHTPAIDAPVSVEGSGGDTLRIEADFEVDPRAAGVELEHLPRTVRAQAAITHQRTD